MMLDVNSFGDVYPIDIGFLSMSRNRGTFVDLNFGLPVSVVYIQYGSSPFSFQSIVVSFKFLFFTFERSTLLSSNSCDHYTFVS